MLSESEACTATGAVSNGTAPQSVAKSTLSRAVLTAILLGCGLVAVVVALTNTTQQPNLGPRRLSATALTCATQPWVDQNYDDWCNLNCNSIPAYCPASTCRCEESANVTPAPAPAPVSAEEVQELRTLVTTLQARLEANEQSINDQQQSLNDHQQSIVGHNQSIEDNAQAINDHAQSITSLAATTATGSPAPGSVTAFAGVTVPNGYLECNGQSVDRVTYSSLFAAIGTMYGSGDGATTFNIPDYRGYFLRGVDQDRADEADSARDAVDLDRDSRGARPDGVDGNEVGTVQLDALQQHRHTFYQDNRFNGGAHSGFHPGSPNDRDAMENRIGEISTEPRRGVPTPRVANETRARNVSVNYIIKV
eukprot:GFYU01015974.1.p1 GENE.GFYU01015974.1~~GFYU01015974.1.p1  ORF type:complete len:365 (-),score=41.18 GFYU01015974.1:219-1313(-)